MQTIHIGQRNPNYCTSTEKSNKQLIKILKAQNRESLMLTVRMKHLGDKAHSWRLVRVILGKLQSQLKRSWKRKSTITGM